MQKSAQLNTRSKKQGGFTLIELMIVVAIIGVLASIAVPQYQNYVGRAQVSEAISLMSPAKTAISEYYITRGEFPATNEQAGLSEPDEMAGKYVASVDVSPGEPGVTVITMKGDSVVTELQDATLVFEPSASVDGGVVNWECRTGGGSQIPAKFLPSECRLDNDD
ncbi:pilin [Vreelandella arctica]|uniref:pilin n=1 Tax=Vreelandella arctica TaxID=3126499 RepID=UPI00300E4AA7|tara:strand:- start:825 stop:1319 length:495 start_codon:yes stop_codon:yes gene_type:complete